MNKTKGPGERLLLQKATAKSKINQAWTDDLGRHTEQQPELCSPLHNSEHFRDQFPAFASHERAVKEERKYIWMAVPKRGPPLKKYRNTPSDVDKIIFIIDSSVGYFLH